jgi:hypothetical protein
MHTRYPLVAISFMLCLVSPGKDSRADPLPTSYMKKCMAAGVPIPPVWGDPAWMFIGNQPNNLVFDGNPTVYPTTEVWKYKDDDKGICVALPRKDGAGVIQLLGIICQGKGNPARACFWDNINAAGMRITGTQNDLATGMQIDPRLIQGGDRLVENCVNCHRGDNAYLIIPGSTEDVGDTAAVTAPYKAIGQYTVYENWSNAVLGPAQRNQLSGDGNACQECHSIPSVVPARTDPANPNQPGGPGYCNLLKAVLTPQPNGNLLMPPDTAPADLDANTKKDIMTLARWCKKYGVDLPTY